MSEIGKRIGHRIKIRRAVLGMTQAQLAQALGVTQVYLSYMERGERPISTEMLSQIAMALNCEADDLMNEKRRLA
jgi:transcriptional regulator with XRE-family HTH domain